MTLDPTTIIDASSVRRLLANAVRLNEDSIAQAWQVLHSDRPIRAGKLDSLLMSAHARIDIWKRKIRLRLFYQVT